MVSIATSPVYNIPKKLSDQEYSQWFVGEPNGKTLENCESSPFLINPFFLSIQLEKRRSNHGDTKSRIQRV